jgi:hypothetical protein
MWIDFKKVNRISLVVARGGHPDEDLHHELGH